jgi:hypothetical protein
VLTDECNPDKLKPVALDEIIATAQHAEGKLTQLYMELIRRI